MESLAFFETTPLPRSLREDVSGFPTKHLIRFSDSLRSRPPYERCPRKIGLASSIPQEFVCRRSRYSSTLSTYQPHRSQSSSGSCQIIMWSKTQCVCSQTHASAICQMGIRMTRSRRTDTMFVAASRNVTREALVLDPRCRQTSSAACELVLVKRVIRFQIEAVTYFVVHVIFIVSPLIFMNWFSVLRRLVRGTLFLVSADV